MFGKHFASMYTGSMVGAGFGPYAVMGYVIANQKPDAAVGFQVELNPALLSAIFGESRETIQKAVDFLCAPDESSRTPAEDGRRIVRIGQFAYRVVNGAIYERIRNEEDRRAQNRESQQRVRERRRRGKALPGEALAVRMSEAGHEEVSGRIAAERMPSKKNGAPHVPRETVVDGVLPMPRCVRCLENVPEWVTTKDGKILCQDCAQDMKVATA